MMMPDTLILKTPDDWHCHLRDGVYLARTVADAAARFARVVVMPNLLPPLTTLEQAIEYYERIVAYRPLDSQFQPLMTLYITEQMDPAVLYAAKASGLVVACKLYPAGATTHSAAGVKQIANIEHLLAVMEEIDLPLLIHGEVTDVAVDIFVREEVFIERVLTTLCRQFPRLRIVLEHISTQTAVQFIQSAPETMAATITAHHLLLNRNDLLVNGVHPHYYCLPILKRAQDQEALIAAAISGHPRFFLGTDSAPHAQPRKESSCGCAGIYTAHAAIELYASVFAQYNALAQLEAFASLNGPRFYRLPVNESTVTLIQEPWSVPTELEFGSECLIPLFAGKTIPWRLKPLENNDDAY